MNFISLAISMFISNCIANFIINVLPLRKKRQWKIGVVSTLDGLSIIGYVTIIFNGNLDLLGLLEMLGSILGVIIAYIASMMLILDGVVVFKSRRLRQFERDLNNKSGQSLPRSIISLICLIVFIVLTVYSIISFVNYDERILASLIGCLIVAVVALGLSIYFFISALPQHKSIKAQNLLFIINLSDTKLLYKSTLTKDFTMDNALGELYDTYMLDEYGLLITPNEKYIVKGIKVNKLTDELLNKINMTKVEDHIFDEAINEFQKYNRKKIILDENNKIVKIANIK